MRQALSQQRPLRAVHLAPTEALFETRANGSTIIRNPHPLGPYPKRITDRLAYWAEQAPNRTFIAQRGAQGQWELLTYFYALLHARSVAQGLLQRGLSPERPLVILSGNSIGHAIVALGALYAGIPYAPLAPPYSLATSQYTTLRRLWSQLDPGMVFAEGAAYDSAMAAVAQGTPSARSWQELAAADSTDADRAHEAVGPDTVAKILFTSGSTGTPKGVINTQRMWCSNLAMISDVFPFLADEPPVICDWLPWNHTFGGNHNVGVMLYNGGSLYIDQGRPTSAAFPVTIANLKEIANTAYFNVPRGFEVLVPALRADEALRRRFFSRLRMVFYAAAGLRQSVWDDLQDLAFATCGEEILMVTGLGCTETGPSVAFTGAEGAQAGRIGLPVRGIEVKLVPVENKTEIRVRGPSVTSGFWRNAALTSQSFDDEGFYCMGDAVKFHDPANPLAGLVFDGRLAEDFKLSTGTWVNVATLRTRLLQHLGDLAYELVIAAPDRDYVTALVFPRQRPENGRHERFRQLLNEFAVLSTGSSTRVERIVLMDDPPTIESRELTDKGSINQKAVLENRAALVEELYSAEPGGHVICAGTV